MPWDMTTLNKQFSPLFMVQRCEWVCLLLLFWPVGYVVQAAAHCKGAHTGKVWSPCLTGPLSDLGLRCLHCYLCLQPQPCSQNEKIDLVGSKWHEYFHITICLLWWTPDLLEATVALLYMTPDMIKSHRAWMALMIEHACLAQDGRLLGWKRLNIKEARQESTRSHVVTWQCLPKGVIQNDLCGALWLQLVR